MVITKVNIIGEIIYNAKVNSILDSLNFSKLEDVIKQSYAIILLIFNDAT